jgi:hypothetical protein
MELVSAVARIRIKFCRKKPKLDVLMGNDKHVYVKETPKKEPLMGHEHASGTTQQETLLGNGTTHPRKLNRCIKTQFTATARIIRRIQAMHV